MRRITIILFMLTTVVLDDFYPTPVALQRVARSLEYKTETYEGHDYKGIGLGYSPEGIWDYISGPLGRTAIPTMEYFRLGTLDNEPTTYIHADSAIARRAAVLYLSDAPDGVIGGTAFWKHKSTGLTHMPTEEWVRKNIGDSKEAVDMFIHNLNIEGNDEKYWQMTDLVGQKFNRITIYHGHHFHSRYPKSGWGKDVNDGRLAWTGFFNLS